MKTKKSILFASLIFVAIIFNSCGSTCHTKDGKKFNHNKYSQNQVEKTNSEIV